MITIPPLNGKTVCIVGLGKSGTATAHALSASGAVVSVWDDAEKARAAATGLNVENPLDRGIEAFDLVVWSPGIPKPHPIAVAARLAHIPVVCDVDLLAQAKPDNRILAVTGTNGKSTTTTLLAHVLSTSGRQVAAGGNLGTAALAMPDLGPEGRYVLELSSYQLELCPRLKIKAGVLLNITPDHLGRHGGMDGYVAAKRGMFDHLTADGIAVIGIDDPQSATIGRTPPPPSPWRGPTASRPPPPPPPSSPIPAFSTARNWSPSKTASASSTIPRPPMPTRWPRPWPATTGFTGSWAVRPRKGGSPR